MFTGKWCREKGPAMPGCTHCFFLYLNLCHPLISGHILIWNSQAIPKYLKNMSNLFPRAGIDEHFWWVFFQISLYVNTLVHTCIYAKLHINWIRLYLLHCNKFLSSIHSLPLPSPISPSGHSFLFCSTSTLFFFFIPFRNRIELITQLICHMLSFPHPKLVTV